MKLETCVDAVEARLGQAGLYFGHGTDNAFDEAAWLVMAASGIEVGQFDGNWQQELSSKQLADVEELAAERIRSRRPLAYLLKQAWFAGTEFYVDERTIVPRSHIGEWIPDRFSPWLDPENVECALDLCTGSGCIAVALALAFERAKVDAVDLSKDALEVAAINVQRHAVDDQLRLIQSDLFGAVTARRYDLIACNPPYVSDELMNTLPVEYNHEPALAFAGGRDGLAIVRRVLAEARTHLTDRGALVVEAGSAAAAVERAWPMVPFTWLTSANGESLVFILSAKELDAHALSFVQN